MSTYFNPKNKLRTEKSNQKKELTKEDLKGIRKLSGYSRIGQSTPKF